MEELTLQHIEGVAYHRGDKDIETLVQEYRLLKEENARLLELLEKALSLAPPAPIHVTVSAERLEELKAEIKEAHE